MDSALRRRRDAAADRHDAALRRWPTREGEGFRTEMQGVIDELTTVAKSADPSSSDPVEGAKAWRWLGDAHFDLGQGKTRRELEQGALAYQRSEELLAEANAPLEKAKLNFSYGNTLRGLSRGEDVGLLEAAQARYELAARAFRSLQFPDWQATVEQQLRAIDPQLRLARKSSEIKSGYDRLQDLQRQLEEAGPVERERIERELLELRTRPGRGDPGSDLSDAFAAIREQFEQHPERMRSGDAEKIAGLEQQVESLQALMPTAGGEERPAAASDPEQAIMAALRKRLQHDEASGRVSSDRATQLTGLLSRLGAVLSESDDDLESQARKAQMLRQLIGESMDLAATPSWGMPDPEPGSRAHRVTGILASLKSYLLAEAGRSMLPSQEASAGTDLLMRVTKLESSVREAASDDDRVAAMEGDVWRLALAVQEQARRYHLMLARPDFATVRVHAAPKSLFVSGAEALQVITERIAQREGVQLLGEAGRGDLARDRWNQLCAASMAVFDVGLPPGAGQAQVCYELGLALSLGKPSIVTVHPGQTMPFDVNLNPVILGGEPDSDASLLSDALDHALGTIVWGGSGGGINDTAGDALQWLQRLYGERLSSGSLGIALDLVEQHQDDAVAFRRSLEQLIGMMGPDAPAVLLSAWPPAYPRPGQPPRCFHVMPFGPNWSGPTRDLAARICEHHGWRYTRGDEAEAQRIIHGIWDEIGRASATLIDITGHNANVALELGLIHALGRPYRVLAQGDPEDHSFPSLEKVQIHSYDGEADSPGFEKVVEELLTSVSAVAN